MKPALIIYGNCQAGLLYYGIRGLKTVLDSYDIYYIESFDTPGVNRLPINEEIVSRCTCFWRQLHTTPLAPQLEKIPTTALIVKFPPLDFGLLWPFHVIDPMFPPELPAYPFGKCPYGDKLLIEISQTELTGSAIFQRYDGLAALNTSHLERYLEMEKHRINNRDRECDIKIADFIFENFRSQRLFWTTNHPTKRLMAPLMDRLSMATWPHEQQVGSPYHLCGSAVFRDWNVLNHQQIPIVASVGRQLNLTWWSDDLIYRTEGTTGLTIDEYAVAYVNERRLRMNGQADLISARRKT